MDAVSTTLPINLAHLLQGRRRRVHARKNSRLPGIPETTGPQVLKTICAFANDYHNLNGGYVVIGVAERDGRASLPPAGLSSAELAAAQKWLRGQLQPARSAVPAAALTRGGERTAYPRRVGAREPSPAASGAGRRTRNAPVLGAPWSGYRCRGAARRTAARADPTDRAGAVGRPPGAGRRPRRPARDDRQGASARDRQRAH